MNSSSSKNNYQQTIHLQIIFDIYVFKGFRIK